MYITYWEKVSNIYSINSYKFKFVLFDIDGIIINKRGQVLEIGLAQKNVKRQ